MKPRSAGHLYVRPMIRTLILLAVVILSVVACGTTPFAISRESLEASKPPKVAIASIRATDKGARVVAYAFAPAGIATFLRQLEAAGAVNVQLMEIKPLSVCERRVVRAELNIEGDSSVLVEVPSSREQLNSLLAEGKGSSTCIAQIPM